MPKIFTDAEKTQLRSRMFEAGFSCLKKEGLTHMSVEKITSACNIGKGTFYHFFDSKEAFVLAMIEYKRSAALHAAESRLNGRDKMCMEEGMQLFRSIASSSNSIYQYLKLEDLLRLQKTPSYLTGPDFEEEKALLRKILIHIENVRSDIDYALAANLLKLIALTMEEQCMFHEQAYEKTIDTLYLALFSCIFEDAPK